MQVVPYITGKEINSGQFTSSVSPKGQITVPSQIRQLLGVKPKDKVAFQIAQGKVSLSRAVSGVDASYQAVPALKRKLTNRQMAQIAWEEHAQEAAQEGLS